MDEKIDRQGLFYFMDSNVAKERCMKLDCYSEYLVEDFERKLKVCSTFISLA
jgi:hypothetical protein